MFGGFCLLFFVFAAPWRPRVGVWLFLPDVFWLLGQIFLIRILSGLSRGFCLESLILAQDERWRRA